MSPSILIFPQSDMDGPSFFVKKRNFYKNFISETDSMDLSKNRRADSSFKLPTLDYIGCFVSFKGGLLCQGRDFFCAQSLVVNANVINQAGEESLYTKCFLSAEIQASVRADAGNKIDISRRLYSIHI